MVRKHYREVKKALKKGKLVDTFALGKYAFSPYGACGHACKYCDGRAEKYYVQGDFERDIVIRSNLPDLLKIELPKLREPGNVSIGSGISDPYQPVDKEEGLMRQCASVLAEHDFSAALLTKSSLVMRDIDLWKEVHKKSGFTLMVSLTFTDDSLRQIFEPGASPVEERFAMLEAFKKEGMNAGVLALPLLPHISDNSENILKLVERLAAIGVDFIYPGGLTLRPGRQKDLFMHTLRQHFPHLEKSYIDIYREERQSGAPVNSYNRELSERIIDIFSPFSMPVEVPHHVYKDRFPIYDEVYILLAHMRDLYLRKGVDVSPLEKSRARYIKWLLEEKTYFNRKRKLDYRYLEDKFLDLVRGNPRAEHIPQSSFEEFSSMAEILGNEKLAGLIEKIALERMTFDYVKLAPQSSFKEL
ncbi:MAG: radical SAM protein [bacterium]|nr:radical SAM protein [bacterium]